MQKIIGGEMLREVELPDDVDGKLYLDQMLGCGGLLPRQKIKLKDSKLV